MIGSANHGAAPAPVLVLGLGNLLLADDGVGLRMLEVLGEESNSYDGAAEFLDGGTQGLALLPYLADRAAILVLDAIGLGERPGTVHVLSGPRVAAFRARRASAAHESNSLELLETARMLGYTFEDIAVVGVEPFAVRTRIGLSPQVEEAVETAVEQARRILSEMVEHVSCNTR